MTDVDISYDNTVQFGDISLYGSDLLRDEGLMSSVLISLFTDRRVARSETRRGKRYRGGYVFEDVDDIPYGSRLFLLDRNKTDLDTVRLLGTYAKEALAWLVDEEIASNVDVRALLVNKSRIDLTVKIFKGTDVLLDTRFEDLWNSTFQPPIFPIAPDTEDPTFQFNMVWDNGDNVVWDNGDNMVWEET